MAVNWGKTPLQKLKSFRARKWFRPEFENFATRVATDYSGRSEITSGGIVTGGTAAATTLSATITALECVLGGQIMAATTAIGSEDDLLDGVASSCGVACWGDGTMVDDTGLTVAADETAWISLIITNSDDGGGATETDNGAPLLVAVIAGDADKHEDAATFLNAREITAALSASAHHKGVTGWALVAECELKETASATTFTQTWEMQRNNTINGR